MKKIYLFIFLFVVFFNQIFALDVKQFEFLRPIVIEKSGIANQEKNFNFVIDDLIYRYSKGQFLSDLRVVDQNNNELPYILHKQNNEKQEQIIEKKIPIVKVVKGKKIVSYILDFGDDLKYRNKLKINTSSVYFSRLYQIYASDSLSGRFDKIDLLDLENNKIFNKPTKKNFLINYRFTKKRYLKVNLIGSEGDLNIDDFIYSDTETKTTIGKTKEYDMEVLNKVFYDDKMEFLLKMPYENIPVDYLTFLIKNSSFNSDIEIYSSNYENAKFFKKTEKIKENSNYWKKIYQSDFSREIYIDDIKLNINDNKKYYFVVIKNKNKNKKKQKKIDLIAVKAGRYIESIFLSNLDFSKNKYYLLYGNNFVFKPKYVQISDSSFFDSKKKTDLKALAQTVNPVFNIKIEKKVTFVQGILIFFLSFFFLMSLWFVYKNYKENRNRDIDDVDYIEKI